MITAHAHDTSDIERRVRELRAEIARLRAKRRELSQRIASSQGRRARADRKIRNAGTQRAVHVLEVERNQVDERIAVLEATARSIQDYGRQPATASTSPGQSVDLSATQKSQAQGTNTVVRTSWFADTSLYQKWTTIPRLSRSRLIWTLGNALMLVGVVLLLYVGGIYAQAEYDRYAARGDTDLPAPRVIANLPAPAAPAYQPAPFTAPDLSTSSYSEGPVRSAVPDAARAAHQSTITRVAVPSIGVDSKVVEVGWDVTEQNGQQVAVWQVAEYAVGQHRGSANPGEGDNVVLAGHVGGYGKVFKNLFYINPGDQITLYSGDQQYLYTVQERLILTEEGVSPDQQAANAQYIAPTGSEVVTLVTCWPPKGADKFTQRIVVRAVPFGASAAPQPSQSRWTIR
ncbi:MAG TPA: sortase [Roseiflexaceae bacterium]|nr:sortase [Roseiflexaceae bacterium]